MKRNYKKWSVYLNNIISTDLYSAVLLMRYMKLVTENKLYVPVLEIIEINKDELFIVSKN